MTGTQARPLADLRRTRSSVKWRRYPEDVLPLFVAEMDFDIAPEIVDRVTESIRHSDTGYLDGPGPLAGAFADFARCSWGWSVAEDRVHLATDVTVGIVETLRLALPPSGGRVVITPPVYPPFFEMIEVVHARRIEVPLAETENWSLDLTGIEAAFAAGADAFLLCNPQNPTGRAHDRASLVSLARLAARFGVLVISDEVHAPLAHPGTVFTPFATVAADEGARSVTVTSASKGWNLAGLKCALAIAGDADTARLLNRFPEELAARTSILGLHANTVAFSCRDWLAQTVETIARNVGVFQDELQTHLPEVTATTPDAGYLIWLDLRALELGEDPAARLVTEAKVALNSGPAFGAPGSGFARLNLACDPATLVEAVRRIRLLAPRPVLVPGR